MAVKSDNAGLGSAPALQDCPETKKVFDDFKKVCTEQDLNNAESAAGVAGANFVSALKASCDDRRTLEKGEKTRELYSGLQLYVSTALCKDFQEAQKCAEDQAKALAELNKTFTGAIAKMKEACTKIQNVKKLASDWNMTVCANCNQKNKDDINKILGKALSDDWKKKFLDGSKYPDDILKSIAAQFDATADNAVQLADKADDKAVAVAGIVSFTNVQSVKDCAERLVVLCETFKKDVDGNAKLADEKIKAAQKALSESVTKLSEADFACLKASALKASANDMITNYLGVFPPLKLSDKDSLDEICKAIDEKLKELKPDNGDSSPTPSSSKN